jgi:hypothetical protein
MTKNLLKIVGLAGLTGCMVLFGAEGNIETNESLSEKKIEYPQIEKKRLENKKVILQRISESQYNLIIPKWDYTAYFTNGKVDSVYFSGKMAKKDGNMFATARGLNEAYFKE